MVRVHDVPVKLDLSQPHERLYALNLEAGIRYAQSDIDGEVFRRFLRTGNIAIDGGANIGITSLQMLEAGAKHVYAFEPAPLLFERLEALLSNAITKMRIGLGERSESRTLFLSETHNQGSTIDARMLEKFPHVFGEHPKSLPIQVVDLNSWSVENAVFPDFLKLDVEGAELPALRGARDLLFGPQLKTLYLELYHDLDEVCELLGDHFPGQYRALLSQKSGKLVLKPLRSKWRKERYFETSPMYVFTKLGSEVGC